MALSVIIFNKKDCRVLALNLVDLDNALSKRRKVDFIIFGSESREEESLLKSFEEFMPGIQKSTPSDYLNKTKSRDFIFFADFCDSYIEDIEKIISLTKKEEDIIFFTPPKNRWLVFLDKIAAGLIRTLGFRLEGFLPVGANSFYFKRRAAKAIDFTSSISTFLTASYLGLKVSTAELKKSVSFLDYLKAWRDIFVFKIKKKKDENHHS